eukprot:CAMPEP_0117005200 /NCGR_PEP_ID=MMETSP0472-20121206/5908_1 /TAXON_ID=693140 ORGANISM="Tiarina fusus, Strain LIS" /NCGR_SAMPLE_ID=MMETSP0472 /ASSEMBLY_ACC=CAM_ASM_000603 /LENGTH=134 /DNA_ID=CAMNT_0004706387 /DNA_START=111 /DNA_END=512 /DNA_ORIENTATION=-
MNVLSVLQKRQLGGKDGAAAKKQKITISTEDKPVKRTKRKHSRAHTLQVERIHKFYTSEICSLQSAWESERSTLQENIDSLRQQLANEQEEKKLMEEKFIELENLAQNYALLYNESAKEIEENKEEQQKKKAIL